MSIFEALVLGLVQGLTEFIPVSSSGHLLLAHELFGSAENSLALDLALHLGTLGALLIYFRRDIWDLLKNLTAQNTSGRLARLLILATLPAMVFGLALSDYIDEHMRSPLVVAITLATVGAAMLYVDSRTKKAEEKEITTRQGLSVGLMQSLALIPGVSRSGITITTGMFMGLSRVQAARFSFLLAMPITAGSALGILLKDADAISMDGALVIGVITSFISGMFAIRFLLAVIAKVGLKYFAYYRFALAAIVLVVTLM